MSIETQEESAAPWPLFFGLSIALALLIIFMPLWLSNVPLSWLAGEKAAWYLTRASGTVAYLLTVASTLWGLLLSTKLIRKRVPPVITLAMHNYLSWSAIGLTLVHMIALLFDTYFTYTVASLLVPFTGPYEPMWVGLGTLGFYIMVLTSGSYYCRQWIGQKRWRALHYLTFIAFGLVTFHGWYAGTDSLQLGSIYFGSGVLVMFLTVTRILAAVTSGNGRGKPAGRPTHQHRA